MESNFKDYFKKAMVNEVDLFPRDKDVVRDLPSRGNRSSVEQPPFGPAKMEFHAPPAEEAPIGTQFKPDEELNVLPDNEADQDKAVDKKEEEPAIQDQGQPQPESGLDKKSEAKLKEIRNRVIEKFNADNEGKSRIVLKAYEPFSTYVRSFKVTYVVDEEEPYLDKEAYATGKSKPELNEAFFKEMRAIAKEFDVDDVEWKSDDDAYFGTLVID